MVTVGGVVRYDVTGLRKLAAAVEAVDHNADVEFMGTKVRVHLDRKPTVEEKSRIRTGVELCGARSVSYEYRAPRERSR